MPESYNIIFNSRSTSNVIDKTSLNNVTYSVNWSAYLPQKFKKFHCQFIFKSENYAGLLTDNGLVSVLGITSNVYDGNSRTTNLGVIYPVALSGTNSFYNSTNNDNNDFWINYPTTNQITISLKTFAGNNMSNMPNYCLIMNLIGVPDEELKTDNSPLNITP